MPDPRSEPDPPLSALCAAAAGGDSAAAERLFLSHHHRFLALANRKIGADWPGKIEAEDLLQEAYGEAWSSIAKLEFRDEDSFFHWVARIIDQRFIDRIRALRRRKRDTARETDRGSRVQTLAAELAGVSRIVRREDAAAAMLAAMATLPADYRAVIERLHLNQEPIAVVARDMGKSDDAVRRMLGRALDALREGMGRTSRWLTVS